MGHLAKRRDGNRRGLKSTATVAYKASRGPTAELRWSLGITVFAGMIGVTLFGVFLTPVFYYVLERLGDGPRKPPDERVGNDTIASP